MPPLASLSGVDVVLGSQRVLESLSLDVEAGSTVGVAGPNGSGKTTLLRLLATLIRPSAGTVRVFDWSGHATPSAEIRSRIGYVGHTPALNDELTLEENLDFFAGLTGAELSGRDALAVVGIEGGDRRPAKLASQGMRRRADLARLLLIQPELTLLDEPYAGLDAGAVPIVDALVERTIRQAGAAIVVSHDPDRLAGMDRVVTLGGASPA